MVIAPLYQDQLSLLGAKSWTPRFETAEGSSATRRIRRSEDKTAEGDVKEASLLTGQPNKEFIPGMKNGRPGTTKIPLA